MGIRHDLKHSILEVLKHNRDGSKNTQASRRSRLLMAANQLVNDGYQLRNVHMLKPKHINHLVNSWMEEGKLAGTLKNRMTDLRWLAGKLGKPDLVPAKNDSLNIPRRHYITNEDKSIVLSDGDVSKIDDEDVKLSLLLQKVFGLRREESIKIIINQAVFGDELRLKGPWCKNGRPRTVQITYPEQWDAIEKVKAYVGKGNRALIPKEKTYFQQLKRYENQLAKAGIHKAHGLRHAYAQRLYYDLTGWKSPIKGGPSYKMLNETQRQVDMAAREKISFMLGHERLEIVAIYC